MNYRDYIPSDEDIGDGLSTGKVVAVFFLYVAYCFITLMFTAAFGWIATVPLGILTLCLICKYPSILLGALMAGLIGS